MHQPLVGEITLYQFNNLDGIADYSFLLNIWKYQPQKNLNYLWKKLQII